MFKVVRIGHPARLLSVVQDHSLDALLSNSEGTAIVRDVRKDIDDTLVWTKLLNLCFLLNLFSCGCQIYGRRLRQQ